MLPAIILSKHLPGYLLTFLKRNLLTPDYLRDISDKTSDIIEAIVTLKKTSQKQTIFIGINGCQGSGKSTLADYISTLLINQYRLNAISCSLDDFYLHQAERLQLANTIHPLLASRGVPGTHNVSLLKATLENLSRQKTGFALPRFDKASDNPLPQKQWPLITSTIDLVIFEGWCWGTTSQPARQLLLPVNPLEAEQDADGIWRRFVNTQLAQYYQPLYKYMDLWIMLKAPSFDNVYRWRLEQEHKLQQRNKQLSTNENTIKIMKDKEVALFIQHFQRLTEHSLATFTNQADYLLRLDQQRNIITNSHK